jgi:hypothetical protein
MDEYNPFGPGSTGPSVPASSTLITDNINSPPSSRPGSISTSAQSVSAKASVPFYAVAPTTISRPTSIHHTVSPVYTGRGGFAPGETSRGKTLQDLVQEWVNGGLMLTCAFVPSSDAVPKPARQPAPTSPFAVLRFHLGASTPSPRKWLALASEEPTLPSSAELVDLVYHNQWGRLLQLLPPAATLLSAKKPDQSNVDFAQKLLYCRARIAATMGVRRLALAYEDAQAVLLALLQQIIEAHRHQDTEQLVALKFSLCMWMMTYVDVFVLDSKHKDAVSVLSAILINVALPLAHAAPPSVIKLGTAETYLSDPARCGAHAVLGSLPFESISDRCMSVYSRCSAALQNLPELPAAAVVFILTAAGGRIVSSCVSQGMLKAAASALNRLATLADVVLDDAQLSVLTSLHEFSGAAVPQCAKNRWILRGFALCLAAKLATTCSLASQAAGYLGKLCSFPHWSEAIAAPISPASPSDAFIPVGSDIHSSCLSPADTASANIAAALINTLRCYSRIQTRDFEAAQRAGEAAVDVACEALDSNAFGKCKPDVPSYSDAVMLRSEDILTAACLALCSASAKRGNPTTCGFVVLDALLRSSPTIFARPDVVAAYTGLADMSGDPMGAVRTKRILQAALQSYSLDFFDSKIFRVPAV